jgi:serine/tyrosine/threonine adenylyltransferase
MMTSPNLPSSAPQGESVPSARQTVIPFNNTYAHLPEHFFARVNPTPVAAPQLVKLNVELARQLGIDVDELSKEEGVAVLAGNRVAEGSEPIALAYAGHQFAHFVPQLGDGRANLLGEVVGRDGVRYDIQLKGSGRTPFSRGGDGRAAIGPVLREYIVSEAMAAFAVPTTRALAAVTTGELVFREIPMPGAVLTRVAASHLRVGTFQYFAVRQDSEGVRTLADYSISRHYPEAAQSGHPYRTLLESVVARQAQLIAQWMLLGFIHGVMNTDNMSISGETIDYGPCAFMEAYEPTKVYSSIDRGGRYAYRNQPGVALWNLARLAESLLPVLVQESGNEEAAVAVANEVLSTFEPQYESARLAGLRKKLGLFTASERDADLADTLLQRMAANRADFTLTFRRLSDAADRPEAEDKVRALFADPIAFDNWAADWRHRLAQETIDGQARAEAMRSMNPIYIPRNHLVEAALEAATQRQDYQPFEDLLAVVSHPNEERPGMEKYATPARPEECVLETFCGT